MSEGNHSREDMLYQPHEHEWHIAFIQQFYYRPIEFEYTRLRFLSFISILFIHSPPQKIVPS